MDGKSTIAADTHRRGRWNAQFAMKYPQTLQLAVAHFNELMENAGVDVNWPSCS